MKKIKYLADHIGEYRLWYTVGIWTIAFLTYLFITPFRDFVTNTFVTDLSLQGFIFASIIVVIFHVVTKKLQGSSLSTSDLALIFAALAFIVSIFVVIK